MPKDLIIKTSQIKLPSEELKSNLGDLIRSTILLNCGINDFYWLTDKKSKTLIKYFISEDNLIDINHINKNFLKKDFKNIYNLDNYLHSPDVFNNLKGNWKGFVYYNGKIFPENILIKSTLPYTHSKINKSWQQSLVEGLGFEWKEQDFSWPLIKNQNIYDVGLNWDVHPDWISKHWPKDNWNKLEKILKKDYSVSWQQGLNNFDEYIDWISSCETIITSDSLGLHLASALRKKVIAIVGPTDNREFSYNRIKFLKPRKKECMPCDQPKCKMKNHCLKEITPTKVKKTISYLNEI